MRTFLFLLVALALNLSLVRGQTQVFSAEFSTSNAQILKMSDTGAPSGLPPPQLHVFAVCVA